MDTWHCILETWLPHTSITKEKKENCIGKCRAHRCQLYCKISDPIKKVIFHHLRFIYFLMFRRDRLTEEEIRDKFYAYWQKQKVRELSMPKSQQFWVRSQHPPTQWNLRGRKGSSVESQKIPSLVITLHNTYLLKNHKNHPF